MSMTTEKSTLSDDLSLSDATTQRFAWGLPHVVAATIFAAWFLYMNYMPLFHTDLWGHVGYGEWMLDHKELPQEDPFLKHAEGVDIIASAWLSQVVLGAIERFGGDEALSNCFAIISLAIILCLWGMFYQYMPRPGVCTLALFVTVVMGSTRIAVFRTETFGELFMAILLLLLTMIHRSYLDDTEYKHACCRPTYWTATLGIPLLFLVWANSHGSFVVGLAVIGCHLIGRIIDVGWRTRSLLSIVTDRWFRRWVMWTELAVGASLVNPYGMNLLINALTFPKNPNLKDITEWYAMSFWDFEAIYFALSILILLAMMRFSRRRVELFQLMIIGLLAYSVTSSVRMIWWYAVVFAYAMAPHLQDIIDRVWPAEGFWKPSASRDLKSLLRNRSYLWTALSILVLWYGFALSPISIPLLGGTPRTPKQLYSKETPLGLTEFLNEHPPQQAVWNPQWWGDWLALRGPKDINIFMTTNAVHVVTHRVWKDYMRIATAYQSWPSTLDRYNVQTMIVSKVDQQALVDSIHRLSGEWKTVYEDDQALVVSREEGLRKIQPVIRKTEYDQKIDTTAEADLPFEGEAEETDTTESPE
ncbi:MAG: hypothetical protein O2955_02980 [Planctomycetota bacterium]|nr:hypothetical protein [Planctomycetota bacterium]MDA1211451.1 hypothetical protein [Planctomycetota bacterium]